MKPTKMRAGPKKAEQLSLKGIGSTKYFCSKCGTNCDAKSTSCKFCKEEFINIKK